MPVAKLSGQQWNLICFAEQYWKENGFFPSFGELSIEMQLTVPELEELVFSEIVKKHLEIRGIDWKIDRPNSDSKASEKRSGKAKRLTDIQLATVSVILNPADKRSVTAKLESLGVSPATYANWKKGKAFNDFMSSQGEQLFGEFMPDMHNALIDRATRGNLPAIKFAYEVSGRYRPNQGDDLVNVKMMIIRLIEVIQKHVKDPTVIQAIAQDIQQIQEGTLKTSGNNEQVETLPSARL